MAEKYRTGTSSKRWDGGRRAALRHGQEEEEEEERPLMFYMHSSSPAARHVANYLLEKGMEDEREEVWEEWELGCPDDRELRDYCSGLVPTAADRTLAEAKQLQRRKGTAPKKNLEDDLLVPANRGSPALLAMLSQLQYPSQKNTYRRLLLRKVQLFWVRRRGKFPFHHQRAISDELDAAEAALASAAAAEEQAELVLQLSCQHRVRRRPMRVMINHLPSELFLTQKGMLVRCLIEAYGEEGYGDVHPHTALFVLDKPPPYNNRALRSLYCLPFTVHNLKSRLLDPHCRQAPPAGQQEPLLWIVKPAIGSCGRGIQILDLTEFRDRVQALHAAQAAAQAAADATAEAQSVASQKALTEEVYAELRRVSEEYRDESGTELVVQHYVHRPLLYRGYKFDLRVYVLLASVDRPFLALYSTEGYLRVCSDLYDGSGYGNRNAHVTNFHVQREHPLYDPATDSIQGQTTRVSYAAFLDYLLEVGYEVAPVEGADEAGVAAAHAPALLRELLAGGVAEEDLERTCRGGDALLQRAWVEHLLHRQIRRVVGKAVAATVPRMQADEHTCVGQFGLLGVDLLLDTEGHMWLIEFTKSPAFRFQPSFLADLHSTLLREAVDIPIEVEQVRACLPDVRQDVPLEALSCVRDSKAWAILPTPLP